jgi:hypothetical protein
MTDEAVSPVAPAHDRRHDDPQVHAQDPTRLRAKNQRTSPRFSGDHGIRRASRTCGATSSIWRRAALACRPSIKPFRRCGSSSSLRRHEIVEHPHVIHEPRKLPVVFCVEEVARLLEAAPGLKYKAALSVAYGAGLRAPLRSAFHGAE